MKVTVYLFTGDDASGRFAFVYGTAAERDSAMEGEIAAAWPDDSVIMPADLDAAAEKLDDELSERDRDGCGYARSDMTIEVPDPPAPPPPPPPAFPDLRIVMQRGVIQSIECPDQSTHDKTVSVVDLDTADDPNDPDDNPDGGPMWEVVSVGPVTICPPKE